jgi:hypothetical protein
MYIFLLFPTLVWDQVQRVILSLHDVDTLKCDTNVGFSLNGFKTFIIKTNEQFVLFYLFLCV